MRIKTEKGVFSLRWKHENKGINKSGYTTCIVDQQHTNTQWEILCSGKAVKHKGDEYNKEQGRMISLDKALKSTEYLSRENRIQIWNVYHNRKNSKKSTVEEIISPAV